MSKLIIGPKRIDVESLFSVIRDRWESTIKEQEGQAVLNCYTTPSWGRCIILTLTKQLSRDEIRIEGLKIKAVDTSSFDIIDLFIPCDDKHMVGGEELILIGIVSDNSASNTSLLSNISELAIELGLIERKAIEKVEDRDFSETFFG